MVKRTNRDKSRKNVFQIGHIPSDKGKNRLIIPSRTPGIPPTIRLEKNIYDDVVKTTAATSINPLHAYRLLKPKSQSCEQLTRYV